MGAVYSQLSITERRNRLPDARSSQLSSREQPDPYIVAADFNTALPKSVSRAMNYV